MTYLLACLIVLGAAAAAAVASFLVGHFLPVEARRSRHDVGGAIFGQLGILYSVLLAFVFSEVWGEYNTAAQAINGECGALHGAAMLADALPAGKGRPIERAILDYATVVIDREWPAMDRRRRSEQAALEFQTMLTTAARLEVSTPAEVALRGQIVTLLTEAHANRETRTFQIDQSLPLAVWAVLIALAVLLIAFVVFAGVEYPIHTMFSAAFAGCIVSVLVLVRMLDFPFEGALALAKTDFLKILSELSALVGGQ